MPRKQIVLLLTMLVVYVLVAVTYALMPGGAIEIAAAFGQATSLSPWQLALGNAVFILVVYVPAGLIGLWLARKAALPGIYRQDGGWHAWLARPLWIGGLVGIALVMVDLAAQRWGGAPMLPHPPFPASILASLAAGIGEEVIFRLLVMSLWVVLLEWLLRRLTDARRARSWSLWGANVIAALGFAAGHLGTAMVITGVASPAELPTVMLVELAALNGLLGVIAGKAFARDGLVAASGVHFWADIVWHVLYGLLG